MEGLRVCRSKMEGCKGQDGGVQRADGGARDAGVSEGMQGERWRGSEEFRVKMEVCREQMEELRGCRGEMEGCEGQTEGLRGRGVKMKGVQGADGGMQGVDCGVGSSVGVYWDQEEMGDFRGREMERSKWQTKGCRGCRGAGESMGERGDEDGCRGGRQAQSFMGRWGAVKFVGTQDGWVRRLWG